LKPLELTEAILFALHTTMNYPNKSHCIVALLVGVLVTPLGCKREGVNGSSAPPVALLPAEDKTTDQLRTSLETLILNRQFAAATDRLRRADVDLLVADARGRGDLRWVAIAEDTVALPGLDERILFQASPIEYWELPGTSDAILDVPWQATATRFAQDYNERLRLSLEESPP